VNRRRLPLPVLLLILSLVAAACGGGQEGSDGDDPIEQVTVEGERSVQVTGANKLRLGGTLFVPRAAVEPGAKVPGVLFVPTVGAGERNGPVLPGGAGLDPLAADLAKGFAEAGLASYRFDRRGTGESKLEPGTPLFIDDLVADARAGLDLLAQRKETAGTDLAVVGYDEGGLVALRLAAVDPRVKRVVLISSPGRPLVEFQAARLSAVFGPDSGEALRAEVAQMLATGALPPLGQLRTELRPLLPQDQIPFLTELYRIDPRAEAARVRAQALVVAPSAPQAVEAMAPERLAQAMAGSELVLVDRVSPTLEVTGPPLSEDPSDPNSPAHIHGAAPGQGKTERDRATVGRVATWLGGKPPS
jgi:pimeloyl-ACP methyl ester carboxylesterase